MTKLQIFSLTCRLLTLVIITLALIVNFLTAKGISVKEIFGL